MCGLKYPWTVEVQDLLTEKWNDIEDADLKIHNLLTEITNRNRKEKTSWPKHYKQ